MVADTDDLKKAPFLRYISCRAKTPIAIYYAFGNTKKKTKDVLWSKSGNIFKGRLNPKSGLTKVINRINRPLAVKREFRVFKLIVGHNPITNLAPFARGSGCSKRPYLGATDPPAPSPYEMTPLDHGVMCGVPG